jgi:hypothetical protein
VVELARRLEEALRAAFGSTFENPEGWTRAPVEVRHFGRWSALASMRRGRHTLCFLVSPRDEAWPAYRRTAHLDVVYFSEDVPDAEQRRIFERDRATIERFARWVEQCGLRVEAG